MSGFVEISAEKLTRNGNRRTYEITTTLGRPKRFGEFVNLFTFLHLNN